MLSNGDLDIKIFRFNHQKGYVTIFLLYDILEGSTFSKEAGAS